MALLPELTDTNTPFWTGGARGELMITHCDQCDLAIHPPQFVCARCMSRNITPRPAKGTGTVYSFTINYQQWLPDLEVPYALVAVDLDGEPGVRVTSKLVGGDPMAVAIGQKVTVVFEKVADDVWLPQFERLADA